MREFLSKDHDGFVTSLPNLATVEEGGGCWAQIKIVHMAETGLVQSVNLDLISRRGAGIPRFAVPCPNVLVSEGRVT